MTQLHFALLENRGLIRIGGEEATHFLQNLVTCDIAAVDETGVGFGSLLTPQGKILFDFLIARTADGYLLDTPRETIADFAKRLTFYRLRAKVDIEILGEDTAVIASWGGSVPGSLPGISFTDPRLVGLGQRHIGAKAETCAALTSAGGKEADVASYAAHRIALGVPESLSDYAYSDIFPHDADMDQLNGISFTKGCYVGQEVVSRMQHRSTARKRMITVTSSDGLPEAGAEITADDKSVGILGSTSKAETGYVGIALVRLDKAGAARDKGAAFFCGGAEVQLDLPEWASFTWPAESD